MCSASARTRGLGSFCSGFAAFRNRSNTSQSIRQGQICRTALAQASCGRDEDEQPYLVALLIECLFERQFIREGYQMSKTPNGSPNSCSTVFSKPALCLLVTSGIGPT